MTTPKPRPSIMRTLGLTLGDLWSVVKTGKTKPPAQVTQRTSVDEEVRNTEQGRVTLRRTVIEEVSIEPPTAGEKRADQEERPRQ
jgi:hypothetical protein